MELLEERGAKVDYRDPHVPVVPPSREHPKFAGRRAVNLEGSVRSRGENGPAVRS